MKKAWQENSFPLINLLANIHINPNLIQDQNHPGHRQ